METSSSSFIQHFQIINKKFTYRFAYLVLLVLEHIRIFQELLFSHRTDTHFPGSPI